MLQKQEEQAANESGKLPEDFSLYSELQDI